MAILRYPKVLFFTRGTVPTEEDMKAAAEHGPGVRFRNAHFHVPSLSLEECDYVTGPAVPAEYEHLRRDEPKGPTPKKGSAPARKPKTPAKDEEGWQTGGGKK